jgi:hypothetical protein
MRYVLTGVLWTFLAAGAATPSFPQKPQSTAAKAKDQFFTGTVIEIDEASLTINRMVLGKDSTTKKFLLTSDTKFEGGRPKIRAQVTVRYISSDDGDRAVHIIVRRPPK